MKFYKRAGYYIYEDSEKHFLNANSVNIQELSSTRLKLSLDLIGKANYIYDYNVSEIQDINGDVYGTTVQDVADALGLDFDVTIQDQHTPAVIAKFNKVSNSTTTTTLNAIDDYIINVASATGISIGSYIILFNPASIRYMFGYVTAVNTLAITIDTPLDFAFPSGTFVDVAITNMAVDGSTTPQIFGLRGTGTPTGVELTVDITRIIFECQTTSANDLSTFGDIAGGLAKGLVLRSRDGEYHNVFNVKTNGNIEGICYDFRIHTATNPVEGQHGFTARLTFASQGKMGVVQRLAIGEDLEVLVQDALNSLTTLTITAEGSEVKI